MFQGIFGVYHATLELLEVAIGILDYEFFAPLVVKCFSASSCVAHVLAGSISTTPQKDGRGSEMSDDAAAVESWSIRNIEKGYRTQWIVSTGGPITPLRPETKR